MDDRRFDDLSRVVASGASRRAVLRTMAGGLVAGVFGVNRVTGALAQANCGAPTGRPAGCPCQPSTPSPQCLPGLVCAFDNETGQDSGRCCPEGFIVVNNQCVVPGCPEPCPEGTTQQDDCSCLCDAVCPEGTTQQDDCSCLCDAVCPEGTTQQDDCSCLCDAVCPEGTTQQDDCSCLCDAVCPKGTTQQDDCSCLCDAVCKDGEVQEDDCSCVPSTCPEKCPKGSTQQKDCSCVEVKTPDETDTTTTTTTTTVTSLPATGFGSDADGSAWLKPLAVVGAGAAFLASRLRRPAEGIDRN